MRPPATPPEESARPSDLYDYGILPAEHIFDEIAALAAAIAAHRPRRSRW